jgi:hypothetical protein
VEFGNSGREHVGGMVAVEPLSPRELNGRFVFTSLAEETDLMGGVVDCHTSKSLGMEVAELGVFEDQ